VKSLPPHPFVWARGICLVLFLFVAGAAQGQPASPAVAETSDESLFEAATQALHDGRPSDATADLEALGDRGVVDAAVSFDRGLAYAERIRAGGEQPGDLGRAAQGFEEARTLSPNNALAVDASRALALVRAEVARRRARAGEPVELEPGASLGRTIVHALPEDAWSVAATATSAVLGIALFVRWLVRGRRGRIGGTLVAVIAAPVLVLTALAAAVARDNRLHLREGVLVSASARPSDERGIVRSGATPLPEAARVEIVEAKPGWTRVRWGALDAWVPSPAVRPLARAD
jgi:hypothetical protein